MRATLMSCCTLFLSTPSARRATVAAYLTFVPSAFLSTPSARRATQLVPLVLLREAISIHALREEGDRRAAPLQRWRPISIHALREEGDNRTKVVGTGLNLFLSTPSARRATAELLDDNKK